MLPDDTIRLSTQQTLQHWLQENGARWRPATLLDRACIVDRFLDRLVTLELIAGESFCRATWRVQRQAEQADLESGVG